MVEEVIGVVEDHKLNIVQAHPTRRSCNNCLGVALWQFFTSRVYEEHFTLWAAALSTVYGSSELHLTASYSWLKSANGSTFSFMGNTFGFQHL